MNMEEKANLILALRKTGFTEKQISGFQPAIEGRTDIEQFGRDFEAGREK